MYLVTSDQMSKRIGSISGAEDVLDPRRLVIKGSGATYVINSKILCLIQTEPELLFLPKGTVSLHEVFMALAKKARTFNNFEEGAKLSRPADVLAMVSVRTGIPVSDLKLRAMPVNDLPNKMVNMANELERAEVIRECEKYAEVYEPFMEKMYEIYKGGLRS